MGVIWAAGCPDGDKGMSLLPWAKDRSHSDLEQQRIRQQSCQRNYTGLHGLSGDRVELTASTRRQDPPHSPGSSAHLAHFPGEKPRLTEEVTRMWLQSCIVTTWELEVRAVCSKSPVAHTDAALRFPSNPPGR